MSQKKTTQTPATTQQSTQAPASDTITEVKVNTKGEVPVEETPAEETADTTPETSSEETPKSHTETLRELVAIPTFQVEGVAQHDNGRDMQQR